MQKFEYIVFALIGLSCVVYIITKLFGCILKCKQKGVYFKAKIGSIHSSPSSVESGQSPTYTGETDPLTFSSVLTREPPIVEDVRPDN